MYEITGGKTSAVIYGNYPDSNEMSQIFALLNSPAHEGCPIRIMPDHHSGKGCVIGFTSPLNSKNLMITPSLIGVDIGCFTGDTKVRLLDGKDHQIKDLVEKEEIFHVFGCTPIGRVLAAEAIAVQTRKNASLVAITLDNGEVIRCTPDQEYMLRDGTYRQATNLLPGDSLMPLYTDFDKEGYSLIRMNYSGRWQKAHWLVARSGLLGIIPSFDGQRTIIHHKNFGHSDNRPENLQFMGANEHSAFHRGIVDRNTHWQSEDFEKNRVAALHKKAQTPEGHLYFSERGTPNIIRYMKEHHKEFLEKVAGNGKRGAPFLIRYNKSAEAIEKTKREYLCPECDKISKGPAGIANHIRQAHKDRGKLKSTEVIYANHKVVSVTPLSETEDVYCLRVPGLLNFGLSAGVFVHNCGVEALDLGSRKMGENEFKVFDKYLRVSVPSGFKGRTEIFKEIRLAYSRYVDDGHFSWTLFEDALNKLAAKVGTTEGQVWCSAGTLGSGNHFLELDKEEGSDNLYLTVHSGSRNFGLKVCLYHQKKASDQKGMRSSLEWLEGVDAEEYLQDMRVAQRFAKLNRMVMLTVLAKHFDVKMRDAEIITSIHNFIGDDNVVRKGAISAKKGERVIIPWNMQAGLVLGVGKGNLDWNNSAPHGAGRIMSRGEAKRSLTLTDFKADMEGIWSSCISRDTLDECPRTYKNPVEIEEAIGDTVEITHHLKPVYNFKASKDE